MITRPCFLFSLALIAVTASARAPQDANISSKPRSPQTSRSTARSSKPSVPQDENLYQNSEFGFRYKTILGWVDRTEEMQPEQKPASAADPHSGKVLLAVFERPPEVQSDTLNPAVIVAEESAASYPGLKSAADYVGPLTQLVTARGFKPSGDPAEVTLDGRSLVQCDFKRDDAKRSAFQSTLILLQKGSVVSFTFIASTQEEVEDLIEKLSFQRAPSAKAK